MLNMAVNTVPTSSYQAPTNSWIRQRQDTALRAGVSMWH